MAPTFKGFLMGLKQQAYNTLRKAKARVKKAERIRRFVYDGLPINTRTKKVSSRAKKANASDRQSAGKIGETDKESLSKEIEGARGYGFGEVGGAGSEYSGIPSILPSGPGSRVSRIAQKRKTGRSRLV